MKNEGESQIMSASASPKVEIPVDLIVSKGPEESHGDTCLPECIATVARYWRSLYPSLNIPLDEDVWSRFVSKTSYRAFRGVSITRLYRNLPTISQSIMEEDKMEQEEILINEKVEEVEEKMKDNILVSVEQEEDEAVLGDIVIGRTNIENLFELKKFLERQIPPILIYDKRFYSTKAEGMAHAVILEGFDVSENWLNVIDPDLGPGFKIPLHIPRFKQAWAIEKNLTLICMPKKYARIEQDRVERGIQESLDGFVKK